MLVDTDDSIASSRPRIRRDVLYTRTPEGVLFHDANSGFHLKSKSAYQLSTLIIPHLTGTLAVQSICCQLPPDKGRMVLELVRTLYQRGFARAVVDSEPDPDLPPAVTERFGAQLNYIDHYVDDAAARFHRFRSARIAVVGTDRMARACALGLARNGAASIGVTVGGRPAATDADFTAEADELRAAGCPLEVTELAATSALDWLALADFDLIVVTPAPDGPQQLKALLSHGVPAGKMLLPAWICGDRAVLGPLTKPGRPGCWMCAVLRIAANSEGAVAADLWSRLVLAPRSAGDGRRPSEPLAAMIGNLLAYEAFRILTGCLPPETDGLVLLQNLDSLDTSSEPVLPHPRCPFCACAPGAELPADLELPGRRPPAGTATLDQESAQLLADLQSRQPLVQPHTGPFRRFDDEQLTQTPLKVTVLEMSVGYRQPMSIAAFDLHTVVRARLRALGRAATAYSDAVPPPRRVVDAAELRRQRIPIVPPATLDTASGVPASVEEIRAWTPARSMLAGNLVGVPVAAVRPAGPENDDRRFVMNMAGAGAGPTLPDAVADGLLSAVAFQSVRSVIRGRRPAGLVAAATTSGDAELHFLARSSATMGVDLELLDLTERGPGAVSVVLARIAGAATGTPIWAVASDLCWRGAAVAAGRDAVGQLQLRRDPAAPSRLGTALQVHLGGALLADFEPDTIAPTSESPAPLQRSTDWAQVADRFRTSGTDALLVPTSSADLQANGVETVRVLLSQGRSE